MPKIRFDATLTAIGSQAILRLPQAASRKLPSRGMSMVEGTFNGRAFQAPLEPDGTGSHWFRVSNTMLRAAGAEVGDSARVLDGYVDPFIEAFLKGQMAAPGKEDLAF